jgi:thiamine biosynthesis lipoprotein
LLYKIIKGEKLLVNKTEKPNIKVYAPLIFLLAIIIVLVVCIYTFVVKNYKESVDDSIVSGRPVHQSVYGRRTQEIFKKVKENFLKLEDSLSYDIDGSDVDKINSGAGTKWVKVGKNTIDILDKAHDVSKNSGGIFDITSLPLFKLWGFEDNQVCVPAAEKVNEILKHVNYNLVNINHNLNRVKLDDEFSLISLKNLLSGVLCENAIGVYKDSEISYGIISVSNVTGLYGEKPDQPFWKISLRDPLDNDISIGNVKVKDGYIATFGSSSDKIFLNGEKINKIVNPKTGELPQNDISSAMVFYSDPIIASALSKVCCTADKETGFKILNHYGAEAIFIDSFKKICITKNIYDKFSLINDDYKVCPLSIQ